MKGKLLLSVVGGLAALVLAGIAVKGSAEAATVTFCVQAPVGEVQTCNYSRPYGIKSIFITNVSPDGTQAVVWNQVYDCESPVEVSYLRLGPTGIFQLEACDPPIGVGGGDNGSFAVATLPAEPGLGLTLSSGPVQEMHGIYSACYVDYRMCDLASYECQHLGQGCPPPSSPSKEAQKLKSAP